MAKAKNEEVAAVAADPADVTPARPDDDGQALAVAPRTVRARVLVQCALGAPNDVVEVDANLAETMGNVIDTDPAAVAYAESLGR